MPQENNEGTLPTTNKPKQEIMKLKGKITFLINRESTAIEIRDEKSGCIIVKVELTPDQLSSALSRLVYTDCLLDVSEGSFEKIGKQHECKNHEFKLPDNLKGYDTNMDKLHTEAKRTCPKGWAPENYFRSQNSFFNKDGERWARCTIRRWV